jgi:hypothetical protein
MALLEAMGYVLVDVTKSKTGRKEKGAKNFILCVARSRGAIFIMHKLLEMVK